MKEVNVSRQVDFVLIYREIDDYYLDKFRKLGFVLEPIELERKIKIYNSWFKDTWLKFYIFRLFKYNKVIYLDSDGQVLRNMDHLFLLPYSVSAATMWWSIDWWNRLSSAFMVISPNRKEWEMIKP